MRGITFDDGDAPAIMDALLNAYGHEKQTGIFSGYADECSINDGISYTSATATVTFKKGAVMICGRVVYIKAGETLVIPLTATSTGCFGIKVDLSKSVGASEVQFEFFSSTTAVTTQDDLLNNETDGVYYFKLYDYVSNGSTIISTTKTTVKIDALENILAQLISDLADGTIKPKASQSITYTTVVPTSSPMDGTLIIYVGSSLPLTRYDRVIYIII